MNGIAPRNPSALACDGEAVVPGEVASEEKGRPEGIREPSSFRSCFIVCVYARPIYDNYGQYDKRTIAFYSINGRERGLAHFSVWTRGRHAGRALICRYMAFLESVVFSRISCYNHIVCP